MAYRTVGSVIGSRTAVDPPCKEDLRELIVGHHYPWIGLGVLQQDVVVRLVLLYEVVFEKEGVRLGVNHGKLRIGDPGDEQPGLGVQPLGRDEVLGHPLVEVLGLAHIDNFPRGIVVAINPRGMWEQGNLLLDGECLLLVCQAFILSASHSGRPRPRSRLP